MSEDKKGKLFLQLIEEQNQTQWKILQKLNSLIKTHWNSDVLRAELESLMNEHKKISEKLNSLDENNSML